MNNLQTRLELQISAQQWADTIMSQYNISATEMEDALTKVLLNLKQKVIQEYLIEQQRAYQENIASSHSIQETEEVEEENEQLN